MRQRRTISPFNEPNTAYWRAGNNQEGCHFGTPQQSRVLERLAAALEDAGLAAAGVGIAASDETSIDTACSTWGELSPRARAALAQVNTHSVRPGAWTVGAPPGATWPHCRPVEPCERGLSVAGARPAPALPTATLGLRHAARATCGAPSKSACGHESAVRQLMCSRTTVHRREGRVRMRGSITDAPAGSVPGALRARRWPPGALCAHRARWPHAARRVGACAMGGRARAQYEEALASRLLRRPGSALGACCGRGGGGYLATARAELRDAVRPAGKRLWASEFGCGTAPLDDMRDAVALSAVILQARPPRLCAQSCCLALSRRARWRRPVAWRGCAARGAAPPCVVQHGGRWLSTVECVRGADRPPRARAPGPQRASGKRVGVLAGDRELGDRQLLGPHPGGRLQRSQFQRPSPACLSSPPKLLIAPAFQACPAHGHARGQGVRKVQHRGRARSCPSIRAPA